MQIINVLRDHRRRLAGTVEARERKVSAAGPGGRKLRIHDEAPSPGFVAHVLTRKELIERNRLILCPESPRRTEVRNATLGGNSGPGERRDHPRRVDALLQLVDCGLQIRTDNVCLLSSTFLPGDAKRSHPCDICTPCCACAT